MEKPQLAFAVLSLSVPISSACLMSSSGREEITYFVLEGQLLEVRKATKEAAAESSQDSVPRFVMDCSEYPSITQIVQRIIGGESWCSLCSMLSVLCTDHDINPEFCVLTPEKRLWLRY